MRKNFWIKVAKDNRLGRSALVTLIYLDNSGPWKETQSELGDLLKLDRKTICKAVGILEDEGYIKKRFLKHGDGRMPQIILEKNYGNN